MNSAFVEPTIHYKTSTLKKIQHILEIIFLLLLFLPLKLLGYKNNVRIYRFIFRHIAKIPACKKRALTNLEYVYTDLSPEERDKIAVESWVNLGNVAADFAFSRSLFHKQGYIQFEGLEILEELKAKNQNAIFFSGHIATWEIFRIAAYQQGVNVAMIYRAFNNPYFDSFARYLMDYGFAPVFQKGTAGVKKMMRHLRSNGNILILTDQRLSGGADVPFFGKNAKTAPSVAEISLKYNIPLIPIFVKRDGIGKFIISIEKPLICTQDSLDKSQKVNIILEKMNQSLEKHIRCYPNDWFWLHRRWKH